MPTSSSSCRVKQSYSYGFAREAHVVDLFESLIASRVKGATDVIGQFALLRVHLVHRCHPLFVLIKQLKRHSLIYAVLDQLHTF